MRRKRFGFRRRHGAATVELGLCLPIIVVFCLGSIEASTMIYLKQSLTIAAYEGARLANAEGSTEADVVARCDQILTDRRVKSPTVTVSPASIETIPEGTDFFVECSAPCASNVVVSSMFFGSKTLSGRAEFVKKYNGQ